VNKIFICIFFLIFPTIGNTQDILELYKSHIPKIVFENQESKQEVRKNLKTYGELDPDLIYYYLTHLQLRYDSQISNSDLNLAKYLEAKVSKTKRIKRNWARTSLYDMADKYDYSVLTRNVSSLYNKFRRIQVPLRHADNNRTVDTNLLNFYKFLFLSQENETYNPERDYQKLYEEILANRIDFFSSIYDTTKEVDLPKRELIIYKAFESSYLFKDSYLHNLPSYTDFQLFELIRLLLKKDYKTVNEYNVFFPVEVLPKSRMKVYKFTDPMNYTYRYYYKFDIQRSAYANIGFKFKIKDEINPGSHIRVSLGYSLYQSASTTFSDTTLFSGNRDIPGLYFEGDYIFSSPRDIKTFAFTSEFSFPVLYFTKEFFLEAGFHYKYQRTHFKFNFTKPGTLEQPFSDTPQPFFDDTVINMNRSYHILRPVISLNYLLLKGATLRLDYIFPTNIRLAAVLSYRI